MAHLRGGGEMPPPPRPGVPLPGDYNLAACHETRRGRAAGRGKGGRAVLPGALLGVFRAHLALGYLASGGRSPAAADHFGAVLAANAAGDIESGTHREGRRGRHVRDGVRVRARGGDRPSTRGRRRVDERRRRRRRATSNRRRDARQSEETARAAARAAAALDAARPETRSEMSPDELRGDALAAEAEARALVARAAEMGDARARCAWARVSGPTRNASRRRRRAMRKRPHARRRFGGSFAPPRMGSGRRGRGSGTLRGDGRGGGTPDARLARRLYAEATALEDAAGTARLAEMEEREWTEAKERGELHLLPTAPTLAWRPDV